MILQNAADLLEYFFLIENPLLRFLFAFCYEFKSEAVGVVIVL